MADQLKGRTVFITGSGGVLGSTYVRRMLAEDLPHIADAPPLELVDEAVGDVRNRGHVALPGDEAEFAVEEEPLADRQLRQDAQRQGGGVGL